MFSVLLLPLKNLYRLRDHQYSGIGVFRSGTERCPYGSGHWQTASKSSWKITDQASLPCSACSWIRYKYWIHETWSFPACGQAQTACFGLSKTSQRSTHLTFPLPRLQLCYWFRCYLEREVFIDFQVFSSLTPASWLTLPWHLQQHSGFIRYTRFKSFHGLSAFHSQLPHHSTRGWQRQSLVCRETVSTGSRGALIFLIWHFTDNAG